MAADPDRRAAVTADARELVLTRRFEAPIDLVFRAWTAPEHLARWWGPAGFTLPSCTMDLRPGGRFRFGMRSAAGTDHWLRGTYREIEPPRRLVFTFAWELPEGGCRPETLVTVTLAADAGGTRLTLHQAVFESDTARDAHRDGWTGALARLAEHLAGSQAG